MCPVRERSQGRLHGFAVFGGFWGTWGASIPAVREQAGLSDAELGTALLFVGAGALPAMLFTGRGVDRWGVRLTAALLVALGAAGVLAALTARDLPTLAIGLTVLGACSGATDVAINTAAGAAQHASATPVLSRAHALFSAMVVLSSLTTGGLRAAGAPTGVAFLLLAAAAVVAALAMVRTPPPGQVPVDAGQAGLRRSGITLAPLLLLGGLGALAFAVENGHQSWSALVLQDELTAGPVAAAAGPAVFAGVVALTRLITGGLGTRRPVVVLAAGAMAATIGTTVLGLAPTLAVGVAGLAVAAAGTAVLLPTLLGVLTTHVTEAVRGSATSLVTAAAYLGFLAGPVYVGTWSGAVGLSGAVLALAGLAAALALLGPPVLGRLTAAPRTQ